MKKINLFLMGLLSSMYMLAQDATGKLDVNINSNGGGGAFYQQIWFWVVVGLVFILLLVALLRGKNN